MVQIFIQCGLIKQFCYTTSRSNGDLVLLLAFQNPMLILWNANLTQYFIKNKTLVWSEHYLDEWKLCITSPLYTREAEISLMSTSIKCLNISITLLGVFLFAFHGMTGRPNSMYLCTNTQEYHRLTAVSTVFTVQDSGRLYYIISIE